MIKLVVKDAPVLKEFFTARTLNFNKVICKIVTILKKVRKREPWVSSVFAAPTPDIRARERERESKARLCLIFH